MATGMDFWVAASTIATGAVTVGGAILGFLINSTRREIAQNNKLLNQRITAIENEQKELALRLETLQKEQSLRLESLQRELAEHKLDTEKRFIKREDFDDIKLSLAEIKALIIAKGETNAGKKG